MKVKRIKRQIDNILANHTEIYAVNSEIGATIYVFCDGDFGVITNVGKIKTMFKVELEDEDDMRILKGLLNKDITKEMDGVIRDYKETKEWGYYLLDRRERINREKHGKETEMRTV